MPTKPATEAQYSFLRSLLAERDSATTGVTDIEAMFASLRTSNASTAVLSQLISAVKDLPKPAATAPAGAVAPATNIRPNKFAGRCHACGGNVEALAGRIERNDAGKWLVQHLDGQCPEKASAVLLTPGLYTLDGGIWWVREGRKSGNTYAMRLLSAPDDTHKPAWDFVRGGLSILARGGAVRDDDGSVAARLGHASHYCCFCGLALTDDGDGRSVKVGYGPICARRYNLPWG